MPNYHRSWPNSFLLNLTRRLNFKYCYFTELNPNSLTLNASPVMERNLIYMMAWRMICLEMRECCWFRAVVFAIGPNSTDALIPNEFGTVSGVGSGWRWVIWGRARKGDLLKVTHVMSFIQSNQFTYYISPMTPSQKHVTFPHPHHVPPNPH